MKKSIIKILDIHSGDAFVGTFSDFIKHVNRSASYKSISEIKYRKWFYKNYKIIPNEESTNKTTAVKKRIKEKDKKYKIFDKKNDFIFEGTISEFTNYIGKKVSYKSFKDIRSTNWFKKNYKIIVERKRIQEDKNSTYILKKPNISDVKCKRCLMCGYSNLPECGVCLRMQKEYYTRDEFRDILKLNDKIEATSEFINKSTPIEFKCKICGYKFSKMPRDVLKGVFCSNCKSSIGEQNVAMVLNKNNILFKKEKTFPDLIRLKHLRFDFYLPDYNAVIEFDGIQHFRPVKFSGQDYDYAIEYFKSQKDRDSMKNEYCRKNNMPMLRIRYDEKDVESTIIGFIKKIESTAVSNSNNGFKKSKTKVDATNIQ